MRHTVLLHLAEDRFRAQGDRRVVHRWSPPEDICLGREGWATGGTPLIETPRTAAGDREVQKQKAVDYGQLATVEEWEETSRSVHHEIGDRHVTREDKADDASEQTQCEK